MDTPERGILRNADRIKDEEQGEAGLDGAAAKEQHTSHQQSDDGSQQDNEGNITHHTLH
jgi:hypothetical protein